MLPKRRLSSYLFKNINAKHTKLKRARSFFQSSFFSKQEFLTFCLSLTVFLLIKDFFVRFLYYRPLLKLVDRLLLVGMLRNEDVFKLLIMINPETWDPTFDKGKNKVLRLTKYY